MCWNLVYGWMKQHGPLIPAHTLLIMVDHWKCAEFSGHFLCSHSHCCRCVQPLCELVTVIKDKTHIEFARPSDATEIGVMSKNEIEFGLGWKYIPEKIAKLIDDNSRNVVVARVGSNMAGFGIMTYYEDQANLDLLAVKRSFRRMRIGTQIVSWLEKVALTAGAFNIFVEVRLRNTGAIEFYESLGFLVLDEQKGYYRGIEAGVIMAKTLRRMFNAT
jgi:ribosomal-protein-alanine N-acetyltransferase